MAMEMVILLRIIRFQYLLFAGDEYDTEDIQNRFVMVVVVTLISDLLHVLHFLHHYILKRWKNFYGTLNNFPQILTMTMTLKTLKTTNFKNFATQHISEKSIVKHLD